MVSRRLFLKTPFLAVSVSSLSFSALANYQLRPSGQRLNFADQTTIHYIANAYLKQVPEEADLQILRHRSGLSYPLKQATAMITDDFEHEEVLFIDGWTVSRTEARLCVLMASANSQ